MTTDTLQHRIDETARRAGRVERWSAWLQGATCLLAVAMAIGAIDLLFPLPAIVRRTAAVGWLLACGAALAGGARSGTRARRRPSEAFAVLLERGRGIAHNSLINAVQFAHAIEADRAGGASLPLMHAQIEQSRHVAEDMAVGMCVDRRCLRRRGFALAALALITAATGVLWPSVWRAIAPRFYAPAGDHPPFCRTQFTVRYETNAADGRIARGDDVRIIVDLTGGVALNQAWLMPESDGEALPAGRIELFRRSETQWLARLDGVRDDLTFRVHIPQGYSKRQHLRLATIPRITAARIRYAPPDGLGRQPYETPLAESGIREEAGTLVTLTIVSDRPLARGDIRFADGRSRTAAPLADSADSATTAGRPPTDQTDHAVRAAFVLQDDGHLTATITDIDGMRSRDRIEADTRVGKPSRNEWPTSQSADPVSQQYESLLRGLSQLVKQMEDLSRTAAREEDGLKAKAADATADGNTRKRVGELAADEQAFRRRAGELARQVEQTAPPRGKDQASPRTQPAGDGGQSSPRSADQVLETLSDALKETAERGNGRGLDERMRDPAATNGEAARGVQRMLDDLRKDAQGLCGEQCRDAAWRLADAERFGKGGTQSGNASPTATGGQGTPGQNTNAAAETVPDKPIPDASAEAVIAAAAPAPDNRSPGGQGAAGQSTLPEHGANSKQPAAQPLSARQGANVETIRPDEPVSIDSGPIRGERIPARYRDLTEAYFRRLAEDNR